MARYVLESRLGAGGMAEVFRARQTGAEGFERAVALKRMAPALSDDPEFSRLFVEEARLAARLVHPNIVSVLDFDRDDGGALFLVMELVDGCDLRRLEQAVGREIGPPVAAYIAGEVLKALAYAHEPEEGRNRVLHRDVSPHNVLVSRAGAVKLADFGIAKATSASAVSRSATIKGKLAYMAPEQARGEALDARADLFAVGVVLYELLAGERPFVGNTEAEVLARLLRGTYAPLRERVPGVPEALAGIVDGLLMPDPDARFPSASAALEALVSWEGYPPNGAALLAPLVRAAGQQVAATAVTPPVRETRATVWVRPSRRVLIGLGVAAVLSVGAAILAFTWPGRSPAPRRLGPAAPAPASAAVPASDAAASARLPDALPDASPSSPSLPSSTGAAPDAAHEDARGRRRDRRDHRDRPRPSWEVDLDRPPSDLLPVENE